MQRRVMFAASFAKTMTGSRTHKLAAARSRILLLRMSRSKNRDLHPGTEPHAGASKISRDRYFSRYSLRFLDSDLEDQFWTARFGSDLRQLRFSLVVAIAVNVGFLALELFVLNENLYLVALLRLVGCALVFAVALAATFTDFGKQHLTALAVLTMAIFSLSYTAINGMSDAPDIYISGYILAILFTLYFVPLGFRNTSSLAIAMTLLFATLVPFTRAIAPSALLIIYAQFLAALVMGIVALYWLERLQRRNFVNLRRIGDERGRYRVLLNQILPTEIVERLEKGEGEIADEFAESTVLFADIVGFTAVSERHKPAEVLALLNRIFRSFDALAAGHEVEKIKTNGDAYMAAGGLPQIRPGHCEAIAGLALDMMQAVTDIRWPDGTPVSLRIGIHTGPLIAGVIGKSRFAYDLWGDTVNTASRMESHSSNGRIQVSDSVRAVLGDAFTFDPHGTIDVKGKGPMKTWFLTGRSDGGTGNRH